MEKEAYQHILYRLTLEEIMKLDLYIEVAVIQTYETMYSLIMIFE